jgi:hypothetical protein
LLIGCPALFSVVEAAQRLFCATVADAAAQLLEVGPWQLDESALLG